MALAAGLGVLLALPALAHRPGETYVYLVVEEGELSGEIHVREIDIDFLEEHGRRADAKGDYVGFSRTDLPDMLRTRLTIMAGGKTLEPVIGGPDSFGEGDGRFVTYPFTLPDLATVPDTIEIAFPFIFDGPNPRHRTMALIASNVRTGLDENEALPSLVFGPGSPRQPLSLGLPAAGRSLADFAVLGVRQVLQSWQHLALVLALAVIGVQAGAHGVPHSPVREAGVTSALFALGLAGGAQAMVATGGWVGPTHLLAACGAAGLAVILLAALLPAGPLRYALIFAAALALGSVSGFYIERIGLEAGRPLPPAIGFFLGSFAASLALALLAGPVVQWARRSGAALALRGTAVLLAAGALVAAWDTARFM